MELRNDWALALQKANRHKDAAAVLQEACALDPKRLQSFGNLAVALKASGDLEGAVAAGRAAAELAPTHGYVRHNLGLW